LTSFRAIVAPTLPGTAELFIPEERDRQ